MSPILAHPLIAAKSGFLAHPRARNGGVYATSPGARGERLSVREVKWNLGFPSMIRHGERLLRPQRHGHRSLHELRQPARRLSSLQLRQRPPDLEGFGAVSPSASP